MKELVFLTMYLVGKASTTAAKLDRVTAKSHPRLTPVEIKH